MPNTCFDGDFRQKPQQNFAGVNRNLGRDQLLHNAAQERKQREEMRKHTQFSIRFQAHARRYISQQRWFGVFRSDFDVKANEIISCNVGEESLAFFAKRLTLFYTHKYDRDRIFLLNKLLIENKDYVIQIGQNCKKWKIWLKMIFGYNISLLASLSDDLLTQCFENIVTILNLFHSYLNHRTFENFTGSHLTTEMWNHLVTKFYFRYLRQFIDKICTLPIYSSVVNAIKQDLLLSPLSIENLCPKLTRIIVRNFLIEFLSGPLSEHVKSNILPQICASLPPSLNSINIISAFDIDFNIQSMDSYSFIWLFFSTLKLINAQSTPLNSEQIKKFLSIIGFFSEHLSNHIKNKENFHFNCNDKKLDNGNIGEEEDDNDFPDNEDSKNEKIFKNFIEDIFQLINGPSLCRTLVRCLTNNAMVKDMEPLISVSYLCHSMLLFSPQSIHKNRLLHSLAFNSNFLRDLWKFISTESTVSLFESTKTYLNIMSSCVQTSSVDWHQFVPPLTLFCALFNYFLQTLDDVEFFNEFNNKVEESQELTHNYSVLPFKLSELVRMSSSLRDICISLIELAYQDRKVVNLKSQLFGSSQENAFQDDYTIQCWNMLLKFSLKLLRHLYARDIRRQFCPDDHWISSKSFAHILPDNFNQAIQQRGHLYREFLGLRHLGRDEMNQYGSPIPVKDIVNVTIIQELPFVVPFEERVKIMQSLISFEKRTNERDFYEFLSHNSPILIRRNYIYEDAFDKFSVDRIANLKKVVRIQLVSALGLEETGIDGGGVFREFLSEILKTAFDPNRGFFRVTNNGLLYPNPSIDMLVQNHAEHYFFIGRLLGKAIYENMLTELPLAPFFLAKLLANNSDVEINHLASLDPVLYKNLISLKNYKGDVSELGLDFSVINCELGTNTIDLLKENGANIPVTNNNRIEYIHLMSDYKLNKQIRRQCTSFKHGFYNVVNLDWIKMFDTKELQILLSGAPTPIDLNDLMRHTVYSGGYSQDHPVIKTFWEVVSQFDEHYKRKLLKFITSCSRPPLLGFKDLYPALCIQNAGKEPDRLPTSSTCMNLLKLPEVYDKKLMQDKLVYSINSGSGFELS